MAAGGAATTAALLGLAVAVAGPGPEPGPRAEPAGCACRANGHRYGVGERACIDTPFGPRLAECRLVQNVTSWSVLGGGPEACVVSWLRPGEARPERR